MGKVAVVRVGGGLGDSLDRGLELIGGLDLKGGEVVIKPNICNSKNPYGMVLTDIGLITEVISRLKPLARRVTVVESDNIDGPAEKRIRDSGLMERLEKLDVEFINLTREDDFEVHKVAGAEIQIPRKVLEADYFVNIPKIKTCGPTLVTLSIKNLFGLIPTPKKSRLHGLLDEVLPYLAKIIRHSLIVVDGIMAMEGNGPVIGTPRPLGLIVLGRNPVEVDSVITSLMGFNPDDVNHIARAHRMGVGEMSLEKIEVLGDAWKGIRPFERPYTLKASIKCLKSIGKLYLP